MSKDDRLIFKMINDRFDRLETKVDCALSFQWKLVGAGMVLIGFFGLLKFAVDAWAKYA